MRETSTMYRSVHAFRSYSDDEQSERERASYCVRERKEREREWRRECNHKLNGSHRRMGGDSGENTREMERYESEEEFG